MTGMTGLLPRRKRASAPPLLDSAPVPVSTPILWRAGFATGGRRVRILVGVQRTVDQTATVAQALGVSDAVIGLTVGAVGTSCPNGWPAGSSR